MKLIVKIGETSTGPFDPRQILTSHRQGLLSDFTPVATEGTALWFPLAEHPALKAPLHTLAFAEEPVSPSAPLATRAAAGLIDWMTAGLALALTGLGLAFMFAPFAMMLMPATALATFLVFVWIPHKTGRTPGGHVLSLDILDAGTAKPAALETLLVRWLFLGVGMQFAPLYFIPLFFRPDGRNLHDVFARTVVTAGSGSRAAPWTQDPATDVLPPRP